METIQSYFLMHKEIPVAGIRLDSVTASISTVGELFAPAHVPVGILVKKGKIDRAADVAQDVAYSGDNKER